MNQLHRIISRTSMQSGQGRSVTDEALKNIYSAVLDLEHASKVNALSKTEILDVELLRDRLSRIYDKARGVK